MDLHVLGLALSAALALSQMGCLGIPAAVPPDAPPLGTLDLSTSQGNSTLAPTVCLSGERELFLGADFRDPHAGFTARLLIEPTGQASLRIFATSQPLDEGVLFRRADCTLFQLSFERTGWLINDFHDLRAALEVDCLNEAGDSVKGRLAVDHCH